MKWRKHSKPAPQLYHYVITLEQPWWPRKLADELSFAPAIFEQLVSVTDVQNSTHIYGATFTVKKTQR